MKKYSAKPEVLEKKGNEDLYQAEQAITQAIDTVVALRTKKFGEKAREEALPQTLRRILEHWEKDASMVAASSYLSMEEASVEVDEEKQ